MRMTEFRSGADIAAPASHVWPILADVENWPQWAESFERIERLGNDVPLGVGARVTIKQPRLPAGEWTITEWKPGRSFKWEMRKTGLVTTGDHWLDDRGDACRFEQSLRFEGPVGKMAAFFSRSLIRRYMALEAEGLKAISESTYAAR